MKRRLARSFLFLSFFYLLSQKPNGEVTRREKQRFADGNSKFAYLVIIQSKFGVSKLADCRYFAKCGALLDTATRAVNLMDYVVSAERERETTAGIHCARSRYDP